MKQRKSFPGFGALMFLLVVVLCVGVPLALIGDSDTERDAIEHVRQVCGAKEADTFRLFYKGEGDAMDEDARDWVLHRPACGGGK